MTPYLRPLVRLTAGARTADLNDLYRRVINRNTADEAHHAPRAEVILRNEKRCADAVDALSTTGAVEGDRGRGSAAHFVSDMPRQQGRSQNCRQSRGL